MTAIVELKASDLNPQGGVFCPSPLADMKLWSGHPKVLFLLHRYGMGESIAASVRVWCIRTGWDLPDRRRMP